MVAAYDPNNILAKILREELPCVRVYEDEATLGIMDIMPRAQGHMLVIPKTPVRNLLDANAQAILPHLMTTVWRLSRAAQSALKAHGITIEQFNELAGGQSIFHLHIHILPRWEGIPLNPPMMRQEDSEVLARQAKLIADHIVL